MEGHIDMDKAKDLKEHFAAILGRDFSTDVSGGILLREPTGLSTTSDGKVVSRDVGTTGASSKRCSGAEGILDVSGIAITGAAGKVEFHLSDFHCEGPIGTSTRVFLDPPNFLCTPLSTGPVFLTASRTLIVGGDVKLTVFSWDPTGAPAPGTPFDWRCRVAFVAGV
jgi:hypothetical protein